MQAQQALVGIKGFGAQQRALDMMQESAGQRFIRQRQERALLRNASAIGGLGGGNVRSALQEQAAGFAQQDLQNQFNRLGATSQGEQAAMARRQQAAANLGGLRGGFGAQQAATIVGQGQSIANQGLSRAQGITAQAAGLRGGIQQAASTVAGYISGGAKGALQGFAGRK